MSWSYPREKAHGVGTATPDTEDSVGVGVAAMLALFVLRVWAVRCCHACCFVFLDGQEEGTGGCNFEKGLDS
jgi:hypothetical protein